MGRADAGWLPSASQLGADAGAVDARALAPSAEDDAADAQVSDPDVATRPAADGRSDAARLRGRKLAAEDAAVSGPHGQTPDFAAALPSSPGTDKAVPLAPSAAGAVTAAGGSNPPEVSAATTSAQPSAPAAPAEPPPPAAQVGHAMAAIHATPDGGSQIRIVLSPAELGAVHVQITRSHDGAASVSVAVERADTLQSLQADLGHLHQALDRAGVPEQRSLVLHLAAPDASPALQTGASGFGGQGAQGGSQQSAQQGRPHGAPGVRTAESGLLGLSIPPAERTSSAWRRAGINITA